MNISDAKIDLVYIPDGPLDTQDALTAFGTLLGRDLTDDDQDCICSAVFDKVRIKPLCGSVDVLAIIRNSDIFSNAVRNSARTAIRDALGVIIADVPPVKAKKAATTQKQVMRAIMSHAANATSHYALSCVSITEDSVVTTDGHRLLILDAKSIAARIANLPVGLWEWNGRTYSAIEGNFPKYLDVIPKEAISYVSMTAGQATAIVERLRKTLKENAIEFIVVDQDCPLFMPAFMLGNVKVDFDSSLNPFFFADALDALLDLGAKKITFCISDPCKPVVFESDIGKVVMMPRDDKNLDTNHRIDFPKIADGILTENDDDFACWSIQK